MDEKYELRKQKIDIKHKKKIFKKLKDQMMVMTDEYPKIVSIREKITVICRLYLS